ncbi:MAG: XRE family transcriptional regulator [Roseburia sp.]|nr:XRE family transcriptional regulator [Roseburia sp.]
MVARKIKAILGYKNIKNKDLAKTLNTSPSNFSAKMRRDNFSEYEMREIADALNCDLEITFRDRVTGKEY